MVQAAAEGGGLTLDANPLCCPSCRARMPHARGVCETCYGRHKRAVALGETTWAALEAAGLVLPAKPAGSGWRYWNLTTK